MNYFPLLNHTGTYLADLPLLYQEAAHFLVPRKSFPMSQPDLHAVAPSWAFFHTFSMQPLYYVSTSLRFFPWPLHSVKSPLCFGSSSTLIFSACLSDSLPTSMPKKNMAIWTALLLALALCLLKPGSSLSPDCPLPSQFACFPGVFLSSLAHHVLPPTVSMDRCCLPSFFWSFYLPLWQSCHACTQWLFSTPPAHLHGCKASALPASLFLRDTHFNISFPASCHSVKPKYPTDNSGYL